jgi:hypothetical protein
LYAPGFLRKPGAYLLEPIGTRTPVTYFRIISFKPLRISPGTLYGAPFDYIPGTLVWYSRAIIAYHEV